MQITGKAIIRLNGAEIRSLDDATLNPGGVNREAVVGAGKVYGYKEETTAPEMECSIAHARDTDIVELSAITDTTILFETDTGARYTLREAWVSEPASLKTSDGTVSLKFGAISCERM